MAEVKEVQWQWTKVCQAAGHSQRTSSNVTFCKAVRAVSRGTRPQHNNGVGSLASLENQRKDIHFSATLPKPTGCIPSPPPPEIIVTGHHSLLNNIFLKIQPVLHTSRILMSRADSKVPLLKWTIEHLRASASLFAPVVGVLALTLPVLVCYIMFGPGFNF